MFKIYLAGPIKGLTLQDCNTWRDYVKDKMPKEIVCYSPLRAKDFLAKYGEIGPGGIGTDTYDHESPLATQRGIMTRDHYDCISSDLIFCNFLGAKSISMGTVMEVAWAFAYRKPLVMCIEPGNLHDHPMIREATNFASENMDECIHIAKSILLP